MKNCLAYILVALIFGADAITGQQPGVYQIRLDATGSDFGDPIGRIVLGSDLSVAGLPEDFLAGEFDRSRYLLMAPDSSGSQLVDLEANACFRIDQAPRVVEGRELFIGIIPVGVSHWSQRGDTLRIPLYQSPDASAGLLGSWTADGFEGHVWQSHFGRAESGRWMAFRATRIGDWRADACADLIREVPGRTP